MELPPAANDDVPGELGALISARLRRREPVLDGVFDRLLSPHTRARSGWFWSNVEACQRASALLREAGATRVLDIGAGVGKFCAIHSLDADQRVFGVERRAALVTEGRALAAALGASVELTQGTLEDVDPARFDAFYCFNPFAEATASDRERFDAEGPRVLGAWLDDAARVEGWLRAAPVGTALVTYNGLGGRIPLCFRPRTTTHVCGDTLRLWVKQAPDASPDFFLEHEEQLLTPAEQRALLASGRAPELVRALCTHARE